MKTLVAVLAFLFAATAFADHGVKRGSGGHCKGAQDPVKCEEREAKIESAKESCKAAADSQACIADAVCGKGEHVRCKERVAKRLK